MIKYFVNEEEHVVTFMQGVYRMYQVIHVGEESHWVHMGNSEALPEGFNEIVSIQMLD